jgi:hypothetical protein
MTEATARNAVTTVIKERGPIGRHERWHAADSTEWEREAESPPIGCSVTPPI